jgi:cytochrome c-type biogenesis protein CcmH/NrfF
LLFASKAAQDARMTALLWASPLVVIGIGIVMWLSIGTSSNDHGFVSHRWIVDHRKGLD